MTSALLFNAADRDAPALASDLSAAGIHVLGAVACDQLVREAVRLAPDVVIGWDPRSGDTLFTATTLLAATKPLPVLVFTSDVRAETLERALAAGIHAWVVQGYGANRLRPLVQLAQARFRREHAQRSAFDDLQHRFEERKLVDRAKGILMRVHQVAEDEAFRRLRAASMQGKQRVGQLSLQLIHAARDAEAVNCAGQLRMLSQRLVKLYALDAAGIDARDARALLAQSLQRVADNLALLARTLSLATFGDLQHALTAAWSALEPLLAAPASTVRLGAIDRAAEVLLDAAEHLTGALESASPVATLAVVNLCGRQRMLSQRLAKQALVGALLGDAPDARSETIVERFECALDELDAVPISSAEIRVELGLARREWQALRRAVRQAGDAAGQRQVARTSESLLALFEQLTERYEKALQTLLA